MKNCFSKILINILSIAILVFSVFSYNFLLHIKENNLVFSNSEINTSNISKNDNKKEKLKNSSEWRIVIPKINLDARNKRRNRCRNFR